MREREREREGMLRRDGTKQINFPFELRIGIHFKKNVTYF